MYYIVPIDCFVKDAVGCYAHMSDAVKCAYDSKIITGEDYDIIYNERIWTTRQLYLDSDGRSGNIVRGRGRDEVLPSADHTGGAQGA